MKRKHFPLVAMMFTTMLMTTQFAHAQLLKKIINSVKQTKTSNESPTTTTTTTTHDTSGQAADESRVFGAFGKAAADNPNDTSATDLITKSLGNMIGGGGVSAADSAKAIQGMTKAKGGSGICYETTTTTNTKKNGTSTSTSKAYMSSAGEGRVEMNLAAMMGAKNASGLVMISRAGDPRFSMVIDDQDKLYSLNVIDTSLINDGRSSYQVTKLGTEQLDGYSCTHAKVVTKSGRGMFSSTSTMELWTSPAVPGYTAIHQAMVSQNMSPQMLKALEDAGCGGYIVKMAAGDKNYTMTMELTKVEKKVFPASLFEIPAGYKESKNNLMISNMMSGAASAK